MVNVTIFGKGNMGKAIGDNFVKADNKVSYIGSTDTVGDIGDIVVLAVPYTAALEIVTKQADKLADKIVIDITNPLNFETWDELVVPIGSSAAEQLADKVPGIQIVKGFNTNFAGTLLSKEVGESKITTTVLLASDFDNAKSAIVAALDGSGLKVIDAGGLKRAHELEAVGFLQMTLAANEQIGWTGGFATIK